MISPYILVYVVVALLTVLSLVNKRYVNVCFAFTFIILTVFLCLRYGQGTDFPAYELVYELAPSKLKLHSGIYSSNTVSVEYGWWILNNVFKSLGFSFSGFIFVLSLVEMVLIERFVRKVGYARYKVLILLLAYPTVYFTYMFSALRQGLVVSIFLGIMLPWFINKKYARYLLMLALVFFFHKASIILILLLFVDFVSIKQLKYLLIPSFGVGLVSSRVFAPILVQLGKSNYVESVGISPFALLERIVMLGIILYLYEKYSEHKNGNENIALDKILKFYLLGICVYFVLVLFPLVASRLCIFFKLFDIWLIPQMLPSAVKKRRVEVLAILFAITCLMTYKNIETAIIEGNYFSDVKTVKFPYVTVYNKEDVRAYRDSKYYDIDVDYNKARY